MSALTPDETLLGLLAIKPRHGYELLECFNQPDQLGRVWKLTTSQIYKVLRRLEEGGLIVGQAVDVPNAPQRIKYHLTEHGQTRLQQWLGHRTPSGSIRHIRVEFLSRLYIARRLQQPVTEMIHHQQQACQQQLATLNHLRQAAVSEMDALALDFVIGQLNAVLTWIKQCEMLYALS
ncbi:MAG: PadR family transcriptional regulator [Anaerolineae bacterium]